MALVAGGELLQQLRGMERWFRALRLLRRRGAGLR